MLMTKAISNWLPVNPIAPFTYTTVSPLFCSHSRNGSSAFKAAIINTRPSDCLAPHSDMIYLNLNYSRSITTLSPVCTHMAASQSRYRFLKFKELYLFK